MGAKFNELAARKQLLAARAALQRAQVAIEIENLREASHFPRLAHVARWIGIGLTVARLLRRWASR